VNWEGQRSILNCTVANNDVHHDAYWPIGHLTMLYQLKIIKCVIMDGELKGLERKLK
jgi:hypothetical protein